MKRTENGALGYESTSSAFTDMLFNVASYRNCDIKHIKKDFQKVLIEDRELAVKFAFYVGDIREGLGERRMFIAMLEMLERVFPVDFVNVIKFIPEYNRWKSCFDILQHWIIDRCPHYTDSELAMVDLIEEQLDKDWENYQNGKPISLLAKWMPSINCSDKRRKKLATYLSCYLNLTPKQYRKKLSALRSYLDVVEVKMSDNRWNEIEYEKVPSKANLNYSHAFLTHDLGRRTEYLNNVFCGKGKMNVKDLFPHEILYKYFPDLYRSQPSVDISLETAWKKLSETCPISDEFNCLVVCDTSGSMYGYYLNGFSPAHCAEALTIYLSENLKGDYKDKFISFSNIPRFLDMSKCNSLKQKVKFIRDHTEVANTDIALTFRVILQSAVEHNIKSEDLPKNILILSDMEFDEGAINSDLAIFEHLSLEYAVKGYQLPRLIFWNVGSRTRVVPIRKNKQGCVLISGFSTNLLKMVLNNELDPFENLKKVLTSERYSPITLAQI